MRTICCVLFAIAACVLADEIGDASGKCGDSLTWSLSGNVLVISGTGNMSSYFPSERPWKDYSKSVSTVIIEEGVTSISYEAFSSFYNLTSVSIPKSMVLIESSAFEECKSLTHVSIPANVEEIGYGPFRDCFSLVSIDVDENNAVYYSKDGVLFNRKTKTLVQYPAGKTDDMYIIPSDVVRIGENAFAGASHFTSVTIPDTVKEFGPHSFAGCRGLTSVTIPGSIKTIESYSFCYCTNLTKVIILPGVEVIDIQAFWECYKLTTVVIPETVTTIGRSAFESCDGLTEFTFPDTVRYFEFGVFRSCHNLKSVKLPSAMTEIPEQFFSGCTSLTSITIPANVKSIQEESFEYCSQLESVFYQGSTSLYTAKVFVNCTALKTVCVSKDYPSVRLCGLDVTSDQEICKTFQGLYDRCSAPLYVGNGTFEEQFMWNATDFVRQSNACGKYQCDGSSGFSAWSLCNDTDDTSRLCANDTCIDNWEKTPSDTIIICEFDNLPYAEFNASDFYYQVKKSFTDAPEFGVGVETNKDGQVIRAILFIEGDDSMDKDNWATNIARIIDGVDKDNCDKGILCKVKKTSYQLSGTSNVHSSSILIKLLMVMLIAFEVMMI